MELNKRRLARLTGLTLIITALLMIPSTILSFQNGDMTSVRAFLIPSVTSIIIGLPLVLLIRPSNGFLKIRDGYMCIFLVIFISSILGAFPYYLSIDGASFAASLFESVAGFSTTSATVFGESQMAHSLILWKSIEHWTGGICVLIFTISLLPLLGVGDTQIATVEAHGTYQNKIAPRYLKIIKFLVIIYSVLTVAAFLYFFVCKTGFFDALILALTTTSTSGVLLHPEGISYYNSFAVEMGVTLFTLLSGISFVIYIHLFKRNFSEIKNNIELRTFVLIIMISTIMIGIILHTMMPGISLIKGMRDSFFQVTSFITTSGFALEDYTIWPAPAIFILIILLFVGGCSASTTGSLKIIRVLIITKLLNRNFYKRIHPRAVRAVRIGNSPITPKMGSSVTAFAITYFITIFFSMVMLSLQNVSLDTAFAASLGTISNSGISFADIGMAGNYSCFHPFLLIYLSFVMIIGRLGFFTAIIVFLPSFWNPSKHSYIR